LNFDLERAQKRIRPQRRAEPLASAPGPEFLSEPVLSGPQLLLDSCVYIDVLQGKAPSALRRLLEVRLVNHSTVCLGELTHLFGRLDPADARTKAALVKISRVIEQIPDHRLIAPTAQIGGEAGMLAGLARRMRHAPRDASDCELLNDATIFLQAIEQGQIVLTRNIRDFSLLSTLVPAGRALFYRT